MKDENEEDEQNKKEEETQLLKTEEKINEELHPNSKQRMIVFIFLIILFLTSVTGLVFFFTSSTDIEVLPPLVFNATSGKHTHTIIFMPGFTNTPENFKNIFTNKINFNKKNDTTIIILRSPLTDVSYLKSKNYSWFDIYDMPMDDFSDINLEDLKKSAKVLEKVVNNEVKLLNGDYGKIIVGGHSQGASISLYQAYRTKKNYGGVFAFSGVLPPCDISEDKRKMKVYYGYGDKDIVILPSFINKSLERIIDFEGLDLHIYNNHTHYVHRNQTIDAGIFLNNLIK